MQMIMVWSHRLIEYKGRIIFNAKHDQVADNQCLAKIDAQIRRGASAKFNYAGNHISIYLLSMLKCLFSGPMAHRSKIK